jgi:hypothetical protein
MQRLGDALHDPAVAVELFGEALAFFSGIPAIGSLSLHGGTSAMWVRLGALLQQRVGPLDQGDRADNVLSHG